MSEIAKSNSSGFVLGRRSLQKLEGVHPDLVSVVMRAIQITACDFAVTEGLRTVKRQRRLYKSGDTKTMNSRHLPKTPLYAQELGEVVHAIDLGAWVDKKLNWDWQYYFQIADAMKQAAVEEGVALTWGGCWALLNDYDNAKAARDAYIARKKASGKKLFSDGPHFELSWKVYPIGDPA